ncbi:MAG: hypothetical protein ACKOAS_02235 [Verrucomicrobiota bacterium]|jgi:hypothetical protein
MNQPKPAKVKAPKSSKEIIIRNVSTLLEMGIREASTITDTSLASKIDEYVLKLGYSNAHVLGVLVQLLTLGKVRVDFRDYSERLQLLDPDDKMSRPEAVALFDDHMSALRGDDESNLNMTQKIVIQPPRIQLPRR